MVERIILILLIVLIVTMFLMIFTIVYNRFQKFLIRIKVAESNIDETLRNKYDTLDRAINISRGITKIDEELFKEIKELKEQKISSFELDRALNTEINEFYMLKEKNPNLFQSEEFIRANNELEDLEEVLVALKIYFNNNIVEYNKLVRTFPTNLLAFVMRYKEKLFFDNKDMDDKNINDFKL